MRDKNADGHGSGTADDRADGSGDGEPPSCENDLALINFRHSQSGRVIDVPVRKSTTLGEIWTLACQRLCVERDEGNRLWSTQRPSLDLSPSLELSLAAALSKGVVRGYYFLIGSVEIETT